MLSNGRLRFGVAVGANSHEYRAMGVDIANRGERIEEQVAVIRKLWTEDLVSFEGKYHQLQSVGISPHPIQKPLPIWMGGASDVVMRRIARIGDGWMMENETAETAKDKIVTLHRYIQEAGRKPEDVQLNIVGIEIGEDKDWAEVVSDWQSVGAGYLDVTTWKENLQTVDQYIGAIRRFKESVGK